jgi:hypothetical protein
VHWTHLPASPQNGVAPLQSVFAWHCAHRPESVHTGAATPQSAFPAHWTQRDRVVLHFGASPEHCASLVQPARQLKSSGLHTGAAAPQSELARQATHVLFRSRQRGAVAGQSVFAKQSTHRPAVASQTPWPPQSAVVAHCTQLPDAMSHTCASNCWHCVLLVHFVPAWHW